MPRFFGTHTAPLGASPPGLVDGSVQGGRVRVYRERITLAGQTTADTVVLAMPTAGETFLCGTMTADVSLGAALVGWGPDVTWEAAYVAADAVLYASKAAGKDMATVGAMLGTPHQI